MRVVYVAGPYRAHDAWSIEQNVRVAERVALDIWLTGKAAALCPHAMTRFYQGAAPDKVWLDGDLEMLRRCDAVMMLPGWLESAGSQREFDEAASCRIPIFETLADLFAWLGA